MGLNASPFDSIYQPIKLGAHTVPGVWAYMFPDDVKYFKVDPEKKASCFNCPQVKDAGFHPGVRCCTVIPRIPNFLMGMALHDKVTAPLIGAYIDGGFVVPEGSNITPKQLIASLAYIVKPNRADPQIICPFLDQESRACQVYAYRSTVCSTFFCHHDHGEAGQLFWEDLQDLGSQIEAALAQWAMSEIGFDREAYFQRFNELQLDAQSSCKSDSDAWSEDVRRHLWGEYFGCEREFYKACADVVVANKKDLYEIASRQKILQTVAYDNTLRLELESRFPAELVSEALPIGEAESIKNIWYSTQLSQRNLQLNRQRMEQ